MDVRRPVLRIVGWGYAAGTVAALAIWLAPVDPPATQLVDLTTFWWSGFAVVLVAVALLRRDRHAAVLFAVPAAVFVWSYAGAFLPRGMPAAEPQLRVASYNTDVAAPDARHVLELVASEDPDILLLQEVFPPREDELDEMLAARFPNVHVDQSEGVGGVGVWSRYPIVEVTPVEGASDRSRATSIVTLDVDGRPLQVASVHLISPCPACGPSILERLEIEGVVRRAEIDLLLDTLDPQVPAVVGGDLNSNERGVAYRALVDAGFADPQRQVGRGPGFTWPAHRRWLPPVLRIDGVFTRGVVPVAAAVPDLGGSDHRPVVVDLTWQER